MGLLRGDVIALPIPDQMRRAEGTNKLVDLVENIDWKDPLGLKPEWWPKGPPDVSPYVLNKVMDQASKAPTMSLALRLSRWVFNECVRWMDTYGSFERFKNDWKILRNVVGLQVRLLVEQACWDKGEPWRQLNTGFKSVGQKELERLQRTGVSSIAALPRSGAAQTEGASAATGSASGIIPPPLAVVQRRMARFGP